jgi:hypothetical protein
MVGWSAGTFIVAASATPAVEEPNMPTKNKISLKQPLDFITISPQLESMNLRLRRCGHGPLTVWWEQYRISTVVCVMNRKGFLMGKAAQGFSLRRTDGTPQTAFSQAAGANPRRTPLIGKRAIYGWKLAIHL